MGRRKKQPLALIGGQLAQQLIHRTERPIVHLTDEQWVEVAEKLGNDDLQWREAIDHALSGSARLQSSLSKMAALRREDLVKIEKISRWLKDIERAASELRIVEYFSDWMVSFEAHMMPLTDHVLGYSDQLKRQQGCLPSGGCSVAVYSLIIIWMSARPGLRRGDRKLRLRRLLRIPAR